MRKNNSSKTKLVNTNTQKNTNCKLKIELEANKSPAVNTPVSADIKVSIITCTNRPRYIMNVFENFNRQLFRNKELIIILNNNQMNIREWILKSKEYTNISVFQIDERKSLGYCLNYGIKKANYNVIAKLDDDDYYGPGYLSQAVKALKYADVVGKYTTYVYFEDSKILAIRNSKRDNRYVYRIEGPTLVFKKEVFNKIKFQDKSLGEDIQFCKDCTKNGIKMYATDKYNYVYIRHGSLDKHAWNIKDELFKKLCRVIGKVDDYRVFSDKYIKSIKNN